MAAAASGRGFGTRSFSAENSARIAEQLQLNLGRDHLASRRGAGGMKLTYVEGWRVIDLANSTFAFNGWSCKLLQCVTEFAEETSSGKWNVACSATVRVTLRDGTSHEDVGFGTAEGLRSRAASLEKAKKQAVTDARKRALRIFGNGMGNCIYNKKHVKEIQSTRRMTTAVRSNVDQLPTHAPAAAVVAALPPQRRAQRSAPRAMAAAAAAAPPPRAASPRCAPLHGGAAAPPPPALRAASPKDEFADEVDALSESQMEALMQDVDVGHAKEVENQSPIPRALDVAAQRPSKKARFARN